MEGEFPHPGFRGIPEGHHIYSTGQRYVQHQYPTTQRYSTYPKVQPQYYRHSFPPQQHITVREKTYSPPPITFHRDQTNTAFHPQSNISTQVPASFNFFNHLQSNPMFGQLQEILAEECLHFNRPSTLIQTVTQDYSGYSVSCQQKLQIHRSHPSTEFNHRASSNLLSDPAHPFYSSQCASVSQCMSVSTCASLGSSDQSLPHTVPSSSESTSSQASSRSMKSSRRALVFNTTPDSKVISTSPQGQTSSAISPNTSQLNSSSDSSSSEQEVDSGIYVDTSLSFQVDSGMDLLQQASDLCGITEEDITPLLSDTSSISDNSQRVSPPSAVLPTVPVLHEFDTTRHETVFNSTSSSHSSLSDYSPIRGDEIFMTTPEEVLPSNALKRKREESEEPNSKRTRTDSTGLDSTQVLTSWYQSHIQYPYPTDEEVQELVKMSGLTHKQVKKWMANKRVRCFNTLSITGNQHPIKFKNIKKKETPAFQPMPSESRDILNQWYTANQSHPYPTEAQREELAAKTGLTVQQVKRWLSNKRSRANNTRRQIPNYFINKFPEYSQQVELVSRSREFLRMSKRRQLDDALDCLSRM
ncbi:uncharacterized protein LOC133194371 [Saccostrea echinata]|uniref:uncharacterized protein LOC133194371 n=1 Tax=Saccostrea echinata TaxID=191078 RepID=UPI002A815236|nr:uncharacterized protein LOC133194371 [Saccostrea echinata]